MTSRRVFSNFGRVTFLLPHVSFLDVTTEDIGYYDYRPVTLLFACFISFQRYALS